MWFIGQKLWEVLPLPFSVQCISTNGFKIGIFLSYLNLISGRWLLLMFFHSPIPLRMHAICCCIATPTSTETQALCQRLGFALLNRAGDHLTNNGGLQVQGSQIACVPKGGIQETQNTAQGDSCSLFPEQYPIYRNRSPHLNSSPSWECTMWPVWQK